MALTTWLALFPIIVSLSYAFRLLDVPMLAGQALSTVISVALLTWVVMPVLKRVLRGWLASNQVRVR